MKQNDENKVADPFIVHPSIAMTSSYNLELKIDEVKYDIKCFHLLTIENQWRTDYFFLSLYYVYPQLPTRN